MPNKLGKYGLPLNVAFCKNALFLINDPAQPWSLKIPEKKKKETIAFDEDGVCSACRYAEFKDKIDWRQREKELIKLCNKHRSKMAAMIALCPEAGGKDALSPPIF